MKNFKIFYVIFFLLPALTLASSVKNPVLKNNDDCAAIPKVALDIGFHCHAKWIYSFTTHGVNYTGNGLRPWNYHAKFIEQVVSVQHQKGVTVVEVLRTLQNHRGHAPDSDFLPRMGTIFYLFKKDEIAYKHWNAYASVGSSYNGTGVYLQYGHLDLSYLATAPILYVLPLQAPGAWHQSMNERAENSSDHFLGGPRCEEYISHLHTALGLMSSCYKITEPSTTTNIENWICRSVGLVKRIEERSGGKGHGSLVYRAEIKLLDYQ